MQMETIAKIATLGTQHSTSKELIPTYQTNRVMSQIEPEYEAKRLLMTVISENLRKKAGYSPRKIDGESIAYCQKLPGKAVRNPHAIGHLKMMLMSQSWDFLLPEWCVYANSLGKFAPEEYAPDLLTYGGKDGVEVFRDYIAMVVGDRGRWLAEQSDNPQWQWVKTTKIQTFNVLAFQDRWKEKFIIEDLKNLTHSANAVLNDLAHRYYSIWSNDLTDAFLEFLRMRVANKQFYSTITDTQYLIIDSIVGFPLRRKDELLDVMRSSKWFLREVIPIFEFRRSMIEALQNDTTNWDMIYAFT